MTLPLTLLLGFLMFRPMVVYTNTRRSVLIPGQCFRWQIPFSQIMLGIEQREEPHRFVLHALDEETGWQGLIWESTDRSEAARVMREVFGGDDAPSADRVQEQERWNRGEFWGRLPTKPPSPDAP